MNIDEVKIEPPKQDAQRNNKDKNKVVKKKVVFNIHLLRDPKDWHAIRSIPFEVDEGDGVDLSIVTQNLNIGHNCYVSSFIQHPISIDFFQVVDPRNFRPFFQYVPNWLEGEDLPDLICGGIMRVIRFK